LHFACFINGDYEKAITSWEKVIHQDATRKQELQPWIEKAHAKLQEKKP
jgi:lipopolysaccharide biosynthesis regulator YciM